ncbi:MAG: PfkB family carbohydrate kinase [Candidatus Omnitrophota bacterium]|nr:PfkB family carbohydrate kinase [Candidatus Omnitrophota bacterium]
MTTKLEIIKEKIFEIDRIDGELDAARSQGKKVVQCHGVFDLLHIGHIRHLNRAKKMGDVLVVSITPDRFVNKGPHRPAFPDQLRAEAIAALDCVDYVVINNWPKAIEAIKLIKPDMYVKGRDYRDAAKDHTGGILEEESAVQSIGGKLVFTDEIEFSSTSLINQHLGVFPKEVTQYLTDFAKRYSSDDVIGFIKQEQPLKVLVIGEAIVDEYQYCEAIGKSSKEPMLAVKRLSTEKFAGGILAVANHVANFCDEVGLVTMLGTRHSQEEFIREKMNEKIHNVFLYREDSPTIVKRRFVESYFFTKMMELYEINDGLLTVEDNRALCKALEAEVPRYDVVIVVDFGHGLMSSDAVKVICDKAKFLAVNAQSNAGNIGYQTILKYPRADYICMAENEIRMEARDRRGDLRQMIIDLAKKVKCERITVTRGKNGCLCYCREEGFSEVPAFAGQVLDRMGAGDSFLSLTSGLVARKVPTEVVGFVGNVTGAQAVATVGHRRSVERAPLFKHIESLLK